MQTALSKDAEKLLCFIYGIYSERRKQGKSKEEAGVFTQDFYKSDKRLSEINGSDVDTNLNELSYSALVARDVVGDFTLTNNGIVYMENRVKNKALEVLDILGKVFNLGF